MKLKLLMGTSLVALLALSAAGCSGSDTSDTTTDGTETTSDTTQDETTSTGEGNEKVDLGISFEAEGSTHTLNYYYDNWYNPFDEYRFESADEGNKLIAINITVENTGTEEADTSNLYYVLHFGGTEPAEMSFYGGGTMGDDTNLTRFPADNPVAVGTTYNGDLLFEVPADTTAADWSLEYNSDFLDFYDDNEVVTVELTK